MPDSPQRRPGRDAEAHPESPAELAQRIEAGDPQAEARLVERYRRAVHLLLLRHTGGRPEAEDLFQETFATALLKLRRGELRDGRRLGAFLAAIARNLAIEHYRKAARRGTEPDSETVAATADDATSQEGRLLDREHALLVRSLLGELSTERDRQLLLRFYIAGHDKEQLCSEYGLDSLQFNRVLHRARQRYKEIYTQRLAAVGVSLAVLVWLLGATGALLVPLHGWVETSRIYC